MKNKEQIIQSFNEKREEHLSSISIDFVETYFVKVNDDFIKGIEKNNNLSEKFIPLFKDFGETNLVLSLNQDLNNDDSCVDIVRCNRCYTNSNGEKKGLDQDQIKKQFYVGLEAFFKAEIVNEATVYHIAEIFSDHDIFLDSPNENQGQVDFSSSNGQKFCLSTYSEGKYPDESSRYVGLKLEIKKEPLNFEKK